MHPLSLASRHVIEGKRLYLSPYLALYRYLIISAFVSHLRGYAGVVSLGILLKIYFSSVAESHAVPGNSFIKMYKTILCNIEVKRFKTLYLFKMIFLQFHKIY